MTESTPAARRNLTATLAFVLGVLVSPMALPLGWFAREQIKRSGENGMGLAISAIVLGSVAIVAWITGIVLLFLWWLSL
ncbi:MAG: DUF4190 domain-containing protein [Microbacteriaceae bacterium]